ncbi:hypothetical protein BV898_13676 [Hypsibius exemplaris]|uniref:Uncharacterized protein n=1 Tax=Hypsibius exemplaris TaxID=2072580 RepID=A0A1W0W9Z5_HYPEX|nr:hypothetical protein BV898_13676 [Hypsibius exemplaris]
MELVSIKRDSFGGYGRPTELRANHFPLTVPMSGYFFHYNIDMKMMWPPRETGGGEAKAPFKPRARDQPPLLVMPDKLVSKRAASPCD